MTKPNSAEPLLPEYRDNPFIALLPNLMSSEMAAEKLSEDPHYDERERTYPRHLRRACIMRLHKHYFWPVKRHLSLESNVSLLIREGYDGRNISDGSFYRHLRANHERVVNKDLRAGTNSPRSTALSMALLGCSGMGKTETVERILRLYPQVVQHSDPYIFQQVVWLKLECPSSGSARLLCHSFFHEMDQLLGTNYFHQYQRLNLDVLTPQMGRVATQHGLGLLVIDEIQNLITGRDKTRDRLLNFLLTMINTIGVPVLFIGTMSAMPLLQETLKVARRASGVGSAVWERMERSDGWDEFASDLWRFQWTCKHSEMTDEIKSTLYEETQGILDLAVKLFMLTQFYVLDLAAESPGRYGEEQITPKLIRRVARVHFKLLEPMLSALKRGDKNAAAIDSDLQTFRDRIAAALAHVSSGLNERGATLPARSEKPAAIGTADSVQVAIEALALFGVSPDIAEQLVRDAKMRTQSQDALVLVNAALAETKMGSAKDSLSAGPARSGQRRGMKPPLEEDDVRAITSKARLKEKLAWEALSEVRYISSAETIYRVS